MAGMAKGSKNTLQCLWLSLQVGPAFTQYHFVASPIFCPFLHSNSHKVLEMRCNDRRKRVRRYMEVKKGRILIRR